MTPEILLKSLSDQTRLRSLMLLIQEGELCVCELTYALDLSQPKISRHLASLRDMQVVVDRRAGQWIYYSINPKLPEWAKELLQATLRGSQKEKQYKADMKKLKSMANRPDNRICV
ncbi:MAG: metalloregulator ArsR/SmtB family transcription factor [Proteobacteria bacterium]|nr:ArsR family transcriptional regulator [Pseudomonadota bacterium]NOG60493.1 metalloregulator ArsR/SmtB family transcription factor [Pseudomonadota bacterium]